MGTDRDRGEVRKAFRDLYMADRSRGEVKALARYQQLFPGFWDLVSDEYRNLERASADSGENFVTRRETPGDASPPVTGDDGASDTMRIGPYDVVRELGRGGMGVVYEAQDTRLPRRVALKVMSRQFATSASLRLRFQREAELASKLDHPNICTVYEAGEDDGTPYLAMRYVEGQPLSDVIGESSDAPSGSGSSGVARIPPGESTASTEGG
ncbi:MAG: protein kinase domain-containing protein, partial [Planctomycetota bacterium]